MTEREARSSNPTSNWDAVRTRDLSEAHPRELFSLYASILNELRRRISRSTNNPVADYAEHLVSTALRLDVAGKSNAGYDAIDSTNGKRYQIKSRRITSHNRSRQLSFIRGLEEGRCPFDYLVGVLLEEDFSVLRAGVIPFEVVKQHSQHVAHVKGWRFVLRDKIWSVPNVRDITDVLREQAERITTEGI
jgi:hypothetical protein